MRTFPACLSKILMIAALASAGSNAVSAAEANDATMTTTVTARGTEVREFDWAKLQARAHVAYVSSGPRTQSGRMIDNDLQTVFRFSESDKSPTVVIELAQNANLHRIVTAFKAEDAKLDVYLLNELPKNANDLRFAKPIASVVDLPDNHGVITADFSVSGARYVALRWTRKKWQEPFEVAEISAFSNDPGDVLVGQDMKLADNTVPNFVAEPPLIPVVSP
jgi:hypothetical protein